MYPIRGVCVSWGMYAYVCANDWPCSSLSKTAAFHIRVASHFFQCNWLFVNKRRISISCGGRFKRVICFACSPGRSPACCDHEIIMMNHVYKERFPKVNGWDWRSLASHWSGTIGLASARRFCQPKWGSSPVMTWIKQHHSLPRRRKQINRCEASNRWELSTLCGVCCWWVPSSRGPDRYRTERLYSQRLYSLSTLFLIYYTIVKSTRFVCLFFSQRL